MTFSFLVMYAHDYPRVVCQTRELAEKWVRFQDNDETYYDIMEIEVYPDWFGE